MQNGNSDKDVKVSGSRLLWLFILELSCALHCAAWQEKDLAASELLATAKQIMDIRAPGSPPFRLAEHLRVLSPAGQWVEGNYLMIWAAPDQWKDELTLPDFHETRIATQGKVWSLRTHRFAPAIAAEVRSLSNWSSPLTIPPLYEHLGEIRNRTEGQNATRCLAVIGEWGLNGELCFDADRGYLRRQSTHLNGYESETVLDNYVPLGEHLIPKEYRRAYDGHSILEALVTEAQVLPRVDPNEFAAPTDANAAPTCEVPTPARPLQKPDPSYTKRARAHKIQGVVIFDVDIDEQGGIEGVSIIKSLTPDLDKAAAQTIKNKWRFKPAACGAMAIPTETVVEVSFRIF
jgi:TonB family protein